MPCTRPLKGYSSRVRNPDTGKRSTVWNSREGYIDQPRTLPCGQCPHCRMERARQWAMRATHEAELYQFNCFLTLTYAPEHLPSDGSVVKAHYQKFLKRLRRHLSRPTSPYYDSFLCDDRKVRYAVCGEYGSRLSRPHYHFLLFGLDFSDKVSFNSHLGNQIFTSDSLSDIWGLGFCTIGALTFESASYVARYVTKKIYGDQGWDHYALPNDPEYKYRPVRRCPEFFKTSLKPGLGTGWFEKFSADVYPSDFVVFKGRQLRPPKFYDKLLERVDPKAFFRVRVRRMSQGRRLLIKNPECRLAVREEVMVLKMKQLVRGFEDAS